MVLAIKTLDKLVDRFKTDHDLLHTAMRSSYYLGMIPLLCEYFNMQLKDEGMRELNEIGNESLALVLKYSVLVLEFVLLDEPDKCRESFRRLEDTLKQEKIRLILSLKDVETLNGIIDVMFLAMDQLIHGEVFDRNRLTKERSRLRIPIKKIIERIDTNENDESLNIFLSAEQPTWMSLFDRRCSLDQDRYTFWWSDIDREKLNQLMLKKVARACKKRDT